MTCKAGLQLLLRVPGCKLWWFYDQRSEQVLINHLKLPVLTFFERLIWSSILWYGIISVLLISCLWFQVNLLSNRSNWFIIFFHDSSLRLRGLSKLGGSLCLSHGIKLFIFKCVFAGWHRCCTLLTVMFQWLAYRRFKISKLWELVDNSKENHEMSTLFNGWNQSKLLQVGLQSFPAVFNEAGARDRRLRLIAPVFDVKKRFLRKDVWTNGILNVRVLRNQLFM